MTARKKKPGRLVQISLFGGTFPDKPKDEPVVEVLEYLFFGQPVRVVVVDGVEWFVLVDIATILEYIATILEYIATILEYRDATNAGRVLRDKHKGTRKVSTLGGTQELVTISEAGLYYLNKKSHVRLASEGACPETSSCGTTPPTRRCCPRMLPRSGSDSARRNIRRRSIA